MIKIIFISRSWPYPPRNGVELPVAELAHRLSDKYRVDMAVWGSEDESRMRAAQRNVSGRVFHLPVRGSAMFARILKELSGIQAAYVPGRFGPNSLKNLYPAAPYDWAWIAPIGGIGVVRACERQGIKLAERIVIGKNDETTRSFRRGLVHMALGTRDFEANRLLKGLRSPLLRLYDRRYCASADLVCMQTRREKERMEALLGRKRRNTRVIVLPNGVNVQRDSNWNVTDHGRNVLYMSHLEGGRAKEADWFLRRVWPRIVSCEPRAILHLVGTPPRNPQAFLENAGPNVRVRGFVPELRPLFSTMALAVVPTPHASGLVNRVQEGLGAGLPLVAQSGPLGTIEGLIPGRDAVAADTPAQFAAAVVELLRDPERREALSAAALKLASKLPSWEDTVKKAETFLEKPCLDSSVG